MRFPTANQTSQWSIATALPQVHTLVTLLIRKPEKIKSDKWFVGLLPQPQHSQGDVLTPQSHAPTSVFSQIFQSSQPRDHFCNTKKKKAWAQSRDKLRQTPGSDSLLNTRFCLFYRIINITIIIIAARLRRNPESYLTVCFANTVNESHVDNGFH